MDAQQHAREHRVHGGTRQRLAHVSAAHFFNRALVGSLADGWALDDVHSLEEGELPRRLWRVTQLLPGVR